jgi:hypothetical protein
VDLIQFSFLAGFFQFLRYSCAIFCLQQLHLELSMSIIALPDALSSWPWPRRINPSYDEVKAEADAWIHSMKAFDAKAQRAFDKCDFGSYRSLQLSHSRAYDPA